MLKQIKSVPAKELLLLTTFANIPIKDNLIDLINSLINIKMDKYSELYHLAADNSNYHVEISIHDSFDDIMFDCYNAYYKLDTILSDAHKQFPNIDALTEMFNFIPIFEKYITITKFSKAKTRQIQKISLNKLLQKEIKKENYEYCSIIKDNIDEL